ncbi:MAG: chromosome segregation protein SMC [Omnitrophica bacterium RBG_13_46_9]|nr:MAG: chromosome segregation protein SMC [Omnitrophica bacterium RBG_13_46_9]
MYFKELEIVGFKSFPYKTKIKFEPGVTAVVGPNGCGKSNISDAIRWAIGEQSPRSLRGSCMEDVIFNGTNAIEPINMAEVSLTLSNEDKALPIDYNEVTVTRRLFRSGESEYIMNKTPVRLKDINSLFMGTGIGASSYSIIEQNKIDLILSSKPEERRYIFEEASGITKYKAKKKEGLRKLEHTADNLVRINDIINEVKRQINSIERHAKKAERYKENFEILKEAELKLAVYELRSINLELGKNKAYLEDLSQKEKNLKLELGDTLALINKYRQDMDDIIKELTVAQQELSDATLFIDKSRHKVELNKERINDLRNLKDNLEGELTGLKEKIQLRGEEINRAREHFDSILNTKEEKAKELSRQEESVSGFSHEIAVHQKELKDAKNRIVDLLAVQTKTKNELIKLGADLQNRKSRLLRLETERGNVLNEKKSVGSLLEKANGELENCKKNVEERARLLDGVRGRLNSCECALEDIRRHTAENENILNSLRSKEEILKEMIETFEGFDKGVKVLMEGVRTGALSGAIGVVADMLEPENGYEAALETALGKKAQAIIVEDRNALKQALAFLGKDKCSAHLLICEDIRQEGKRHSHKAVMEKEGIIPLSSFIKTDPFYQFITDYLLCDIYIVESVEAAYDILNKYGDGVKFVTKNGFFIEKGHIFGGSVKKETCTSIFGRSRRLEEVISAQEVIKKEIEGLANQRLEREGGVHELKQEITAGENLLKKEEIELANVLSRKESVEANLKKIDDELSIVDLEISEVEELINEISVKGNELNDQLNANEQDYAAVQDFVTSLQQVIQDKTKARNDLMFEIPKTRSEISFLSNTEETERKNLNRENVVLEELKAQYETRKSGSQSSLEKIDALERETDTLEKEIDSKTQKELQLREGLNRISDNKNVLSHNLHEKEALSRYKETEVEKFRDQIRNLEIKNKEGELKEINIKEKIRQAYRLDVQTLDLQIDEGINWEDVRNQVEVLKIKIEKLGPVNLVAIEEHKELEERYLFLTQQQEDLVRARESLHSAIAKINRTTRKLFMDTFQGIQVEFKNYFRMLFGGGHAELLLLDDTDVLESGIEIVVRPPGKKLQNLLLLSGGEKALTAIALLFAIFKVKPSPFCILDEVDAALDESNIGRFVRILQDFLKTSQFIVITHNKKTMEMANVLYGITMQEKGVSKIVSVKFAEDENKAPAEKEEALV